MTISSIPEKKKIFIDPKQLPPRGFRLNLISERYCLKCHKIKYRSDFKKSLYSFRDAGICLICQPPSGK